MVLTLHCYCGDNLKYGLLSKHLFQRNQQYGLWKNIKITTNFYQKQRLPVIEWIKKHPSNQVASIKYTLEKKLFQLLLLKVCESFQSWESKKTWSIEVFYLTMPPHVFSVQVKSRARYTTGQWGRVQFKIK